MKPPAHINCVDALRGWAASANSHGPRLYETGRGQGGETERTIRMTTVALQKPLQPGQSQASHRVTGGITGNSYIVDPMGRVVIDVLDAPAVLAKGWVYANIEDAISGGLPTFGTAVLDFGAFPGAPLTEATVLGAAIDSNAVLKVWVPAVASVDHSADEHSVDPPMVSGQVTGSTLVIRANCSGRDRPVPPGVAPGNTANSQMPIPRRQLQPYGKWNVAWAFA
jgi:hypothetical protein